MFNVYICFPFCIFIFLAVWAVLFLLESLIFIPFWLFSFICFRFSVYFARDFCNKRKSVFCSCCVCDTSRYCVSCRICRRRATYARPLASYDRSWIHRCVRMRARLMMRLREVCRVEGQVSRRVWAMQICLGWWRAFSANVSRLSLLPYFLTFSCLLQTP